jgi:hypothetical protein
MKWFFSIKIVEKEQKLVLVSIGYTNDTWVIVKGTGL